MSNRERYQQQLDSLCRKRPTKAMTGIEKEQAEHTEAVQMWSELKQSFREEANG